MALTKKLQAGYAALKAAILAAPEGFIHAAAADVAPFVTEGLVETNETIVNDQGHIAVRLKPDAQPGDTTVSETNSTGTAVGDAAALVAPTPAVKSAFTIEDSIPLPAASGRGRGGNTYPFEQLEVGQSFFVPATTEKPNPAKSLASTVSSATARYAVPAEPAATKKNDKGEDVPVMVAVRKFVVRAIDGGARIWRTQ